MSGGVGAVRCRLAVLVCTYNRPHRLRHLLDRLEEVRALGATEPFRCVVVDDSPEGSAKDAVGEWLQGSRALDVSYVFHGSRNISLARNAAAASAEDAEWWFLLDDDGSPPLEWMTTLLDAQARSGADLICGGVRYVPPDGAPDWLQRQGFLDVNHYLEDAEPEFGCLANALLRASWWREHPEVRFRPEFGVRGGEDLVFLIDARRAGLSVSWTEQAVVEEDLPSERATLRYQLRRKLWTGNVNTIIDLELGVRSRVRLAGRALLKAAHVLRDTVDGLLSTHQPEGRRRLGQAVFVVGMVLAIVGIDIDHE